MKPSLYPTFYTLAWPLCLLLALLLCGCVSSHRSEMVLDIIRPESSATGIAATRSALVVYTAPDPHAHFEGSTPYHLYYSDYEVRSQDGVFVRKVHNDTGSVLEGPVEVNLPAGNYRVHARANGYGWVTVPVVIEPGKVTTVRLDHLVAKHTGT